MWNFFVNHLISIIVSCLSLVFIFISSKYNISVSNILYSFIMGLLIEAVVKIEKIQKNLDRNFQIKNYTGNNEKKFSKVCQIAEELSKLPDNVSQKKKFDLAIKKLDRKIDDAINSLNYFNTNEEIKIPNHIARDFWKEDLMSSIKLRGSLWTNNTSDYEDSRGRNKEDDLIKAQRDAIENKKIKEFYRVFIYNHQNQEEIRLLKEVIEKQLEIEVKVKILKQSIFDKILDKHKRHIDILEQCYDFMIINEAFLYLTCIGKKDGQRIILSFNKDKLKSALTLKSVIDGSSQFVTKDDDIEQILSSS